MGYFVRNHLPDALSYFEAEGLALTGRGKWRTTRCSFHGGGDCMRVNVETGAWVCMNCGIKGGDVLAYHMQAHDLDFVDAARALGAYVDDGQPHRGFVKVTTVSPKAALGVLEFEALLVAVAAGNMAQGLPLTDADRARVMQAAARIGFIAQEIGT